MAMDKVGPVGGAGVSPAVEPGRERFGKVLEEARGPARGAGLPVATEGPPRSAPVEAPRGTSRA
ncbi:ATP-dependent helicase HrpB, partial [Pyxidicoccus sp. 3LFB2]